MSEATPVESVVRVRCACGQRVRVKNARAGAIVQCPRCARSIQLTDADLRAALLGVALQPMQADIAHAPDAIPLGDERLRLARTGSRPGATGEVVETEEELVRDLLNPSAFSARRRATAERGATPDSYAGLPRSEVLQRFVTEVGASFVLGGRLRNLWTLAATVGGVLVPLAVMTGLMYVTQGWYVASRAGLAVGLVMLALSVTGILQFWWTTLTQTASGEDDIPIFVPEWDFLSDAVRPAVTLVISALVAFGPAAWMWAAYRTAVPQFHATIALLVLGSTLWPLVLLSLGACGSLVLLLPDRLVATLRGLGAAYLVAWGVEVVSVAVVIGCAMLESRLATTSLSQLALDVTWLLITMYVGYVLFRTIGLLYRCFAHRLPV